MGVVTSKRRNTASLALRSVGLDAAIDVVGALEDTEAHKPDPAPLLHGAAAFGVEPTQCLYVGDAVVDVQAARAAGMAAVAVTWGAGERADLAATQPDALVDSVAELTAFLQIS